VGKFHEQIENKAYQNDMMESNCASYVEIRWVRTGKAQATPSVCMSSLERLNQFVSINKLALNIQG